MMLKDILINNNYVSVIIQACLFNAESHQL